MFKEPWFRGLEAKDKEALERALKSSLMSDQLRKIVESWERELPITKSDYDSPAWSHKQAHTNGMAEIINRLKSLLTEDQRNK